MKVLTSDYSNPKSVVIFPSISTPPNPPLSNGRTRVGFYILIANHLRLLYLLENHKSLLKITLILLAFPLINSWNISKAIAQIIPDQTLLQNTIITPNGSIIKIEGGTQNGINLFHSFKDFSVPEGVAAFFNNSVDIKNIISRVTGNNISNLQGLIQANGTANLFLINPNGILFSPNAQLNIRGSFTASTANSIIFNHGGEFSATNPQAPPLLTVNVPIGLQLGNQPGAITNQSQGLGIGVDGKSAITGLQVQPGQNISLIGGDIILNQGYLTAFNGKIELASLKNGTWSLQPQPEQFNTPNIQFGSIQLLRQSQIDTSGAGGGLITIQGGTVSLTDSSRILANTLDALNGAGIQIQAEQFQLDNRAFISSSTIGTGNAGDINIKANNSIDLFGTEPLSFIEQLLSETFSPTNLYDGIFSVSAGQGASGNVTLETPQIQILNGATILTPTVGSGSGGNITLLASKSVDINNGSMVVTGTISTGNAGDINIFTPQLRVLQDGYIITSPGRSGEGQGGNITVNADTVELRGVKSGVTSPGGLFTATLGTGGAGDITINSRELTVAEGAQVSASAAGAGKGGNLTVNAESVQLRGVSEDGRFLSGLLTSSSLLTVQGEKGTAPAGDLTVNTQRLVVQGGAQISAATGGEGAAGNLTLNASESIDVVGFATNIDKSVESVSFGTIGDGIVPSSIESNTSGAGSAGDLRINTGRLTVRNGAEIGVRGTNEGAAGNLEIQADRVLLDNEGTISAATVAGTGGNIRLQARRVELRRDSQITTNASNADGGNITLGTSNLVALENSDITANAQAGKGGQVIINAQGVFGTQFREFQTPQSDITATSELGAAFSGAVEISSPEVDPSAGLVELPSNLVDPTTLIATRCSGNQQNQFVITGRGGLPASPNDALGSEPTVINWINLVEPTTASLVTPKSPVETRHGTSLRRNIQEAQGWIVRADGVIELVTNPPHGKPQPAGVLPPQC